MIEGVEVMELKVEALEMVVWEMIEEVVVGL